MNTETNDLLRQLAFMCPFTPYERILTILDIERALGPAVCPQAAVAMGVAAILIKNPEVTRRNLFSA